MTLTLSSPQKYPHVAHRNAAKQLTPGLMVALWFNYVKAEEEVALEHSVFTVVASG